VDSILLIFYEIVLWIIAFFAIPKTIYSFFAHKKYHHSLLPRLGFHYPEFQKNSLPSIWMHAVSMGETKAMVSIARELKHRFPKHPLIISSVTETGHAEAQRSLPFADYHVYLPFDFNWTINKVVKRASPALVIVCESDFWFNFLYKSKKQGALLALVNGKMSERSMGRFRLIPFFSKRLFGLFDVLCVQNDLYRSRLIEAGSSPEKIVVTGNLKLDADYPRLSNEEVLQWKQKLGIQPHQLVLTIGSTHSPEEEFFLEVLTEIWKRTPELRVILVPRRPELFHEVAVLLERARVSWISFTDMSRRTGKEQVILIDAMGLLRMCYQLSDFAIVGGSFIEKVGGHNILEPCWYGKPVLFGPYMQEQLELVDLMKQYGAGIQVEPDQLQSVLEKWIEHPENGHEIGEKGLQLMTDLRGSSTRTLQALEPLLCKLPLSH
jgi:3-deoxy-D-manno-octulosonic-acid transferase